MGCTRISVAHWPLFMPRLSLAMSDQRLRSIHHLENPRLPVATLKQWREIRREIQKYYQTCCPPGPTWTCHTSDLTRRKTRNLAPNPISRSVRELQSTCLLEHRIPPIRSRGYSTTARQLRIVPPGKEAGRNWKLSKMPQPSR